MKHTDMLRAATKKEAFLALCDGTIFRGYSAGADKDTLGEVVFNTGMTGYQEILSDPSYSGQLVVMTCPEIGNTGVNAADMESACLRANGFIVRQINEPSSWRSEMSLEERLCRDGIPAIAGIDTRALTSKLREEGALKGFLSVSGKVGPEEAARRAAEWEGLDNQDYVSRVTCRAPYRWDDAGMPTAPLFGGALPPADLKVVAYDFGIKWNILRSLRRNGMAVSVVPAATPAEEVLAMKPDGVLLSNGPGDPAALGDAIENVRRLLGKTPLMGVCLGHQLLGLALGGRTCRLKFGHHGCNHPVKNLETGRVEITSQNHNFTVAPDSLDQSQASVTRVNLNDGSIEGLEHRREPAFSVQYHPEACPGPRDAFGLFGYFRAMIMKRG